jgi:hypothetical protein
MSLSGSLERPSLFQSLNVSLAVNNHWSTVVTRDLSFDVRVKTHLHERFVGAKTSATATLTVRAFLGRCDYADRVCLRG